MKKIPLLLLSSLLTLLLSGCIAKRYSTPAEYRHWQAEYSENLKVMTEPPGAKIYIEGSSTNYIGESPVETVLTGSEFTIQEQGTYRQIYYVDTFWGGPAYGHQRLSETNWTGHLTTPNIGSKGGWTVKAYKDGYKSTEMRIEYGQTDAFRKAIRELKVSSNGTLPTVVKGNDSILLTLEPIPPVVPNRANDQQQQQQQQQQQTVVIPGNQSEPVQTGTVLVSSNAEAADVYVDGVFVGNTPANLKLKDGIHIIEVAKTGYQKYRKEIRIYGGSELSLRAELTK